MQPEALAHYAESLARFLDGLGASLVLLDAEGRIVRRNDAFRRLIPSAGQDDGERFCDLVDEQQRNCLDGVARGETRDVDLPLARQGIWVKVHAQITRLEDGYLVLARRLGVTDDEALKRMSQLTTELVDMSRELKRKNVELERAQQQIKTLSGMIPICASCKRIRSDDGFWTQVEEYVSDHTEAVFSHSICPECMNRLYGNVLGDDLDAVANGLSDEPSAGPD